MYKLVAIALIAASIAAADTAPVARTAACPADELCLTCDGVKCTACAYGYSNAAGICQFPTTSVKNCNSYSSATACSSCEEGYYLNNNACTAISIANCDVAATDRTKCLVCDNGKIPHATTGGCTDGTACTLANCDRCLTATTCADCKTKFTLISPTSATTPGTCVAETIAGCAIINAGNCIRCESDFYAAANTCKATTAQESSVIFSAIVAFLVFAKLMA